MLLAELLGMDRYREQVKVYATDIDDDALEQARSGRYTATEIEGLPEVLRERYLAPAAGGHVIDRDLRQSVIFGHHDLIRDAPISRIDVLTCRNTLMYFNAETQSSVVSRMHFALADSGALFLGKVEMLLGHTALFRPISSSHRVFVKAGPSSLAGLAAMAQHSTVEPGGADRRHLLDLGFELGRSPAMVVDGAGVVVAVNQAARQVLRLDPAVVGRPLHELTLSYRPVELRSLIAAASSTREPVHAGDVEWRDDRDDVVGVVDVDVIPLEGDEDGRVPVLVTFSDVSRFQALRDDLERANRQLETAYEELQSSNEELETTNEELQSTVEVLETTNEELRSTNEELSSINVELQAINDELRIRTEEVNEVNAFMESILMSLRGGVAVLDRALTVQVWNAHAEELWGLRAPEAERRPFLSLDIGLPVGALREPLLAFVHGQQVPRTVELDAVNRTGQRIRCQVSTSALLGSDGATEGVIVLMEELVSAAEAVGDRPLDG
jgi:two-component system CheB/CheR fusion protein